MQSFNFVFTVFSGILAYSASTSTVIFYPCVALLIYPLVAMLFSLAWMSEENWNERMGIFLQEKYEQEVGIDKDNLGWQTYIDNLKKENFNPKNENFMKILDISIYKWVHQVFFLISEVIALVVARYLIASHPDIMNKELTTRLFFIDYLWVIITFLSNFRIIKPVIEHSSEPVNAVLFKPSKAMRDYMTAKIQPKHKKRR